MSNLEDLVYDGWEKSKKKAHHPCLRNPEIGEETLGGAYFDFIKGIVQIGKKHFEKTGLFLSALINSSKDKEFTILTEHLDKRINLIGYCNKKIVNVKGNAGDIVGWWNEGTISVEGNSGNSVGFCNEGTISVKGDAGDYVGSGNEGTISVEGDAGNNVGSGNKGTISVEGKIKLLSKEANYYRTSKIYEKGKLIVNEGRIMK